MFISFVNLYNQGRAHGSLHMLSLYQFLREQQATHRLRLIPLKEEKTVIEKRYEL